MSAAITDSADAGVMPSPNRPVDDVPRPARPSRSSKIGRMLLVKVLPPVVTFWLFIGLWCYVSYGLLKPRRRFLLPPPIDVLRKGVLDWTSLHPMLTALTLTAKAALIGFVIAVVLGTAGAIIMNSTKWLERSLFPYAVIIQTIPILALVPLIGFTLGFNFRSRILICVMISVFPIVTTVLFGLQSVDRGLHDLFTLQKASPAVRLRKLLVPAALPAFFTGLRTSAGLAVIGAIVGDFFFLQGQPGIGALINVYSAQLQSEQLFTAVLLCVLLGIFSFLLVGAISHWVIGAWHESAVKPDQR